MIAMIAIRLIMLIMVQHMYVLLSVVMDLVPSCMYITPMRVPYVNMKGLHQKLAQIM